MGTEKNLTTRKYIMIGFALTLMGGISWGGSSSTAQFLMQYRDVNTGWLVNIRLLIAGTIILVFTMCQHRSVSYIFEIWKSWRSALGILLFGFVGIYLMQYTYCVTIAYSNSGTATALEYLSPLCVMIYMSIRRKKLPEIVQIFCLILAITGTFFLATHGSFTSLAISTQTLIWGLLSAVTLAANNIIPVDLMNQFGSLRTTGWGMLTGGIMVLPFYKPWQYHYSFDGKAIICLCICILVGTVLAYLMFLECVHRIGPEKASMLACVEPVSATFFTVTFLHSPLIGMDFLGIACILASVTILSIYSARKASRNVN